MSQYCRVSFRTGVTDNVINKKVRVQSPVVCVIFSIGLAPSSAWKPCHTRLASGTRHAKKITGLSQRGMNMQHSALSTQHSAFSQTFYYWADCRMLIAECFRN